MVGKRRYSHTQQRCWSLTNNKDWRQYGLGILRSLHEYHLGLRREFFSIVCSEIAEFAFDSKPLRTTATPLNSNL